MQGADLLTSSDTVQVSKVPHDISMHRYTTTPMEQPSRALWGSVACPRTLRHATRACAVLCATVSGKIEMDLHFVLVSSVLTVSQRNLNEKMKIETK